MEQIPKIRDEHAARFNCDLNSIFDDFERNQKELGLPLVTLPPNRVAKSSPAQDSHDEQAA